MVKLLTKTTKKITKTELKELFNANNGIIRVDVNSDIVKKNKLYINECLLKDESVIDDALDGDYEEGIIPCLARRDYLEFDISYVTRVEKGKLVVEALPSKALDILSSSYTIQIVNGIFTLGIYHPLGGKDVYDVEVLKQLYPDQVAYLIDNGFFTEREYKEDELVDLLSI